MLQTCDFAHLERQESLRLKKTACRHWVARQSVEAYCVSVGGTGTSADLGGSSKYSSETLEA